MILQLTTSVRDYKHNIGPKDSKILVYSLRSGCGCCESQSFQATSTFAFLLEKLVNDSELAWINEQCLKKIIFNRFAEKVLDKHTASQSSCLVSSCSTFSAPCKIFSRNNVASPTGRVTLTRMRALWIGSLESVWSCLMHSDT